MNKTAELKKWKFTSYRKRSIRFDKTYHYNGWGCKMYGISALNDQISPTLAQAAKDLLPDLLPKEAFTADHYGCAFAIIHEALDGNYILISWWEGQNMLCHKVFASSPTDPLQFTDFSYSNIIACVWELEILYFEKVAWTETVLMRHEDPCFEKYLTLFYSGEI